MSLAFFFFSPRWSSCSGWSSGRWVSHWVSRAEERHWVSAFFGYFGTMFWECGFYWKCSNEFFSILFPQTTASSIVYIPFVLVFFFFAIYFYRDFAKNKLNKSSKQIKELESIIVSLEQNDLTFCQSLPCEDKPNDVNNNRKRSHPVISRQQQFHTRQQSELHPQAPPPPSNLFLKNLCKKNTSGSNDHLLAKDGLRSQSVSVDRINAFRMNDPRDEQGLRLDDLYRSKVCRTIGGGGGSQDNVRFSLDNVSLQTYASSFSAYNSIQNTIQHSLASGLQDGGIPDSFQDCSSGSAFNDSPLSRISRKSTSRPNSKMLPPSCPASAPQSSKSINLDGRSSTASINDQQSNDSKMPKKEGEPFNNLSATVVWGRGGRL